MTVDAFIDRWEPSGASEQGNAKPFFMELCDVRVLDPVCDPTTSST